MRDIAFALWRRLPVRLRQRFAHGLIGLMRPRLGEPPARAPDAPLPVVVVGFLSSPSGLGQAARLAAKAFLWQSRTVYGIDLGRYFFEASGTVTHDLPDGRGVTGPAHVIININAPYLPYALWLLGRRFLRQKHVTGYWAWELPALPANWRRGFKCVHDVAVPSAFVADAVRGAGFAKPLVVAPHPVAVEAVPPRERPPLPYSAARPFTVLSVLNIASGFERKNPLALIAAFKRAFGDSEDCRLRLLVTNAEHYAPARGAIEEAIAGHPTIEVCWQRMDRARFLDWWKKPDLYASLHRAEGFGLPLAEAMYAGSLVMATGWSGNLEFMNARNSLLVDYSMRDVMDKQAKYAGDGAQWAEPSVAHAARLLKEAKDAFPEQFLPAARDFVSRHLRPEDFCAAIDSLPHPAKRS